MQDCLNVFVLKTSSLNNDRWMDGWTGGWMNGWKVEMDGWRLAGWRGGWMDGGIDRWMYG